MNDHGLTRENLLRILPPALKYDKSILALAETTAEVLAARVEEIDRARIIPNIDRLEGPLLDILAYDFKVDWWDPEYSVDEKRRTLKDSWRVHKILGTKAAVETAIRDIYPHTTVEEWFQYGGEPYHFRLNINITDDSINSAKQRRVLERVNYYKSMRSHNDGIRYFLMPEKAWAVAGGGLAGGREAYRVSVAVPAHRLEKPGGRTWARACGALGGMYRRINTVIQMPEMAARKAT